MTHSRNAAWGRFAMRPSLQTGLLAAAMTLVLGYAGAQQQDPGQGAGGGQAGQPGQGGGRQGRGGQTRAGGPGGTFGGQMPFSMGTVTGGDPATGVIVIKSMFGSSQTIKVTQDTKFVVMSEIQVSGLKVGDQVQIQGVPTRITASTISAGELPTALSGAMGGRRSRGGAPGGQPGQPDAANPNGADPNGQAQAPKPQPQAMASATGKIVSKEPLTIALSDEISIVLKISDTTKITKIMPASINTIKLGDTILASGTAGQDGIFAATGVGINVNMGSMGGRGSFGGFGGGAPGVGGPGGGQPGGGPGGFGGRSGRGTRGGRGGANGGPGGAP